MFVNFLPYFLPSIIPYTFCLTYSLTDISTSSGILVLFPGRRSQEATKPGISFFVLILCCSIFSHWCMFAFVVFDLVGVVMRSDCVCLYVCLLTFFPSFLLSFRLPYTSFLTYYFLTYLPEYSYRMGPFCFHAWGHRRWPNLALSFFGSFYVVVYFVADACLLLLYDFVFFSTKPRDWLRRTSPKWPILCRVGCKTLTQLVIFLST